MTPPPLIMACFGTRPEAVKLAPVVRAIHAAADLRLYTATTAQHREMLDQMLETFEIRPDCDLDLMRPAQRLDEFTARAIEALGATMQRVRPDAVLVQGDTTTAFCAALASFYSGTPVAHVEAGLRTNHPASPFPEEMNRRLITELSSWHFCPTRGSAERLISDNVPPQAIFLTGSTVIDALMIAARQELSSHEQLMLPPRQRSARLVITLHRRETQGSIQRSLCRMFAEIARRRDIELIFPVHLSPAVRKSVSAELQGCETVRLIEPLPYRPFVHLMRSATMILTDSGGIQEEASAFGVPVLVMRDTTERPEGVEAGCARLSGTAADDVRRDVEHLLDDSHAYRAMTQTSNPYGDGRAARRIVEQLRNDLLGRTRTVESSDGFAVAS
jgi:UDP-N-acetylglucosamine 2-epimerase